MVDRTTDLTQPVSDLHANEQLKARSRFLRGNIAEGLQDNLTGAVPGDDPLLMKFHGIYQQDDRDLRADRNRRRLEPNYQFMVRMRIPGGLLSTEQWQGIDQLSRRYAERGIKITTRQTVQLHGIRKGSLRALMQGIRDLGLDTVAACGDDSRGVVCGSNPSLSQVHHRVAELACETSDRLIPKTGGYAEIWYGDKPKQIDPAQEDPMYGALYLSRKFKVGYVIPPVNDIDVYGQDLGFIAIVESGKLVGFNVCVGGGMGQLDTREDSYPRLAEVIGFVGADEAPAFAETVMGIQRDFGDRKDRHRARFKYTLDRLGNDWFVSELEARRGQPLAAAKAFQFTQNGDRLGWQQGDDGLWCGTLSIENGRVDGALRERLSGFFQQYGGRIRLTTNQNLQLTHVEGAELEQIGWRLDDLDLASRLSPELQDAHTMSCVALPTCGLAMAESERYMPRLLSLFKRLKSQYALEATPITLRITGCPNGCARPYLAEIALTGRAPGLYNLYLGGSFEGDRMAQLYASNINESQFIDTMAWLFDAYAGARHDAENFGDFLVRNQLLDTVPVSVQSH
ncbi:NADPH-dependent assimilatory sulfite reductase hemoprotein subunit [Marinobacter sp. 1Y8]